MIEDERGLVLSVSDRLRSEGYQVFAETRGDSGLQRALAEEWDLFLIDVMLPGVDGFEIVKRLRQAKITTPALLVTAREQVVDRVSGLRLGADDYLVKPFAMDELVARIENQIRRLVTMPGPSTPSQRVFGPYVFDPVKAGVFVEGERVTMTHQEFLLLKVLIEHEGQVVEPAKLLDLAWGYGSEVTSRTLYVHMSWLRQKLKIPDRKDGPIQTVRGFGYLFVG